MESFHCAVDYVCNCLSNPWFFKQTEGKSSIFSEFSNGNNLFSPMELKYPLNQGNFWVLKAKLPMRYNNDSWEKNWRGEGGGGEDWKTQGNAGKCPIWAYVGRGTSIKPIIIFKMNILRWKTPQNQVKIY